MTRRRIRLGSSESHLSACEEVEYERFFGALRGLDDLLRAALLLRGDIVFFRLASHRNVPKGGDFHYAQPLSDIAIECHHLSHLLEPSHDENISPS